MCLCKVGRFNVEVQGDWLTAGARPWWTAVYSTSAMVLALKTRFRLLLTNFSIIYYKIWFKIWNLIFSRICSESYSHVHYILHTILCVSVLMFPHVYFCSKVGRFNLEVSRGWLTVAALLASRGTTDFGTHWLHYYIIFQQFKCNKTNLRVPSVLNHHVLTFTGHLFLILVRVHLCFFFFFPPGWNHVTGWMLD